MAAEKKRRLMCMCVRPVEVPTHSFFFLAAAQLLFLYEAGQPLP